MVIFAAATGLRPAEWLALEWRDIDLEARVVYVHRSFANGRLRCPKTEASRRAVPLQTIALEVIQRQRSIRRGALMFPAERGYLDLHNFRNREWKPAQLAAGIAPLRRIYDLRHTFATFALRAGISTFDLSRYMGASLTMIDRHYGHLARDGREHRSDCSTSSAPANVHGGRSWTLRGRRSPRPLPAKTTEARAKQEETRSPLTDSNRRPPPYHFPCVTRVHSRSLATQFLLQIEVNEVSMMPREASRVSFLMCPFCVRTLSSESATYRTAAAEPLRRSGVAVVQPHRQELVSVRSPTREEVIAPTRTNHGGPP
jgi:Phage integrase family